KRSTSSTRGGITTFFIETAKPICSWSRRFWRPSGGLVDHDASPRVYTCACLLSHVCMSLRVLSIDPLEALVKTQPGHCSKTQGVQEEEREEEIRPLMHRQGHAVATVDREAEQIG